MEVIQDSKAVLGSNGAEVQSITEGEDLCFRLRALLAEVSGEVISSPQSAFFCQGEDSRCTGDG